MTRYSPPPSDQTAAFSQGGCLSGFLLPPLAVILVGVILALLLLGSAPVTTLAADPASGEADQADVTPTMQPISISAVFQPPVQYWGEKIQTWAAAAGLDPNLVATVMQIESCGDPRALSKAGAIGLFQVMPYHFTADDDPYRPDTNAKRGLAYMIRSLAAANGNARLAFAGYNGGIGVIGRQESTWANETRRYAYWGSGIYAEASSGAAESLRLQEWLAAGGASLCRQAGKRLGIDQ
jgi:soluble lytic murein transglycosylase-like protein